jgi:hypothetical protein
MGQQDQNIFLLLGKVPNSLWYKDMIRKYLYIGKYAWYIEGAVFTMGPNEGRRGKKGTYNLVTVMGMSR